MFIGHNFDKVKGYEQSRKRGIEIINGTTWRKLREYIAFAGLRPEQCFFTNALMGLQPQRARGPLKATNLFRQQCRAFLVEQVAIIQPRLVAALGPVASADLVEVDSVVPSITLMHPYASFRKPELSESEGFRLKERLHGVRSTLAL